MKKFLTSILVLSFLIISFPAFASSGEGVSFRINKFLLKISWSWQEQVPSMYDSSMAIPLINLIHSNYSKISLMDKKVWFEYYCNENNTFSLVKYYLVKGQWELIERQEFSESINLCVKVLEIIKKELDLPENPNFVSNVFVVFIPGYYIEPDSSYKKEIETFLGQTELQFAHDMVLQSNVQGYVYSIFFDRHRMYSFLEKLSVRRIIINRKTIDDKGLSTLDIMLN